MSMLQKPFTTPLLILQLPKHVLLFAHLGSRLRAARSRPSFCLNVGPLLHMHTPCHRPISTQKNTPEPSTLETHRHLAQREHPPEGRRNSDVTTRSAPHGLLFGLSLCRWERAVANSFSKQNAAAYPIYWAGRINFPLATLSC